MSNVSLLKANVRFERHVDKKKSPEAFGLLELMDDGKLRFTFEDTKEMEEFPPENQKAFVSKKRPILMISYEGNDQLKLQFLFVPSTAAEDAYKLRDNFKDALASIKSSSSGPSGEAKKVSLPEPMQDDEVLTEEEMKLRISILESDPKLAALCHSLVFGGHLTMSEFWSQRQNLLRLHTKEKQQKVGLSSELIHEVKPTSSVGTDAKFTLTPTIIESIFLHHPRVKKLHEQYVATGKMKEQEFWSKYLQSSYFYKDKQTLKRDNIFDTAAAEEEAELVNSGVSVGDLKTKKGSLDEFLLDLSDVDYRKEYNGGNSDKTMKAGGHLSLIKKLNKHGDIVVSSYGESSKEGAEQPKHKQILRQVMDLDDLHTPKPESFQPLKIRDKSFYSQGNRLDGGKDFALAVNWEDLSAEIYEELHDGRAFQRKPKTAESLSVLQQLEKDLHETSESFNPAGNLLALLRLIFVASIPATKLQELQTLNMNVHEVFRHFWSAIPPGDDLKLQAKIRRMGRLLDKCKDLLEKAQPIDNIDVSLEITLY